jgi:hypothetical protein
MGEREGKESDERGERGEREGWTEAKEREGELSVQKSDRKF